MIIETYDSYVEKCKLHGFEPLTKRSWKETRTKERLDQAIYVLKELHTLLDFDEPVEAFSPIVFNDAEWINKAFKMAYQVIRSEDMP